MYEFHGWAIIRESPNEINTGNLLSIVDTIKRRIEELAWDRSVLDIKTINASFHLYTTGMTNHKASEANEIIDLYRNIAKIAPGSYGILYTWDDEDVEGCENKFKVYVLSRGSLLEKDDTYLSPCVPTIEDGVF